MAKINLIPDIRKEKLKIQKMNFITTTVAIVVAVIIGIIILVLLSYVGVTKVRTMNAETKINELNESLKTYQELENNVAVIERNIESVNEIINGGTKWSKFFPELEKAMPKDVQLTSLKYSEGLFTLTLYGKDVSSVDRFIRSLETFKYTKNDKEDNLFSEVIVNGYSRKDDKIIFEAKVKLTEGLLW